jgi:hypothetical protein
MLMNFDELTPILPAVDSLTPLVNLLITRLNPKNYIYSDRAHPVDSKYHNILWTQRSIYKDTLEKPC